MKTITFYSYKGGAGRSLALANAARYLARLEFNVVALDFDLEAPGLHYKFSGASDGKPLAVKAGVVDYLHGFVAYGSLPATLKDFTVDVTVPGVVKPLVQLIPAGCGPSTEYWSKLSRINWHDLFYSKDAKGVRLFLDLKNRIAEELDPDFLLVDSRTGITEMGGVATTLLAEKVIALVLPSRENLEGARAVLRSLHRSRRESGAGDVEILVALSRLPQMEESKGEQDLTERIRAIMNEEADDLKDTLSCSEIFVLHSEAALEVRESLRVGSGVSPDESVLLRDYLRLFANVVPRELIEPKVGKLIQRAREKIWDDPEAALKEVEELAESFGHPENYRALLRFYEVRNVSGAPVLRRAQRLWELTRDSSDQTLWQVLQRTFEPREPWRRGREWSPDMDFVQAVWRDAGKMQPEFGMKIAEAYDRENRESQSADVLLEILKRAEPTSEIVSRCIALLDVAKRGNEATALIQRFKTNLLPDSAFVEAWARHALRDPRDESLTELVQSPIREVLGSIRPFIAARVFYKSGLLEDAIEVADQALREFRERGPRTEEELREAGEMFYELGRFEEFEKAFEGRVPPAVFEETRHRLGSRRRRK